MLLLIPWLTLSFVREHAVVGLLPAARRVARRRPADDRSAPHDDEQVGAGAYRHRDQARAVRAARAGRRTHRSDRCRRAARRAGRRPAAGRLHRLGRRAAAAGVLGLVRASRRPGSSILLALDSSDDLQRWGHYVPAHAAQDRAAVPRCPASGSPCVAIALALVLPLFVPSNSRNLLANLFHRTGRERRRHRLRADQRRRHRRDRPVRRAARPAEPRGPRSTCSTCRSPRRTRSARPAECSRSTCGRTCCPTSTVAAGEPIPRKARPNQRPRAHFDSLPGTPVDPDVVAFRRRHHGDRPALEPAGVRVAARDERALRGYRLEPARTCSCSTPPSTTGSRSARSSPSRNRRWPSLQAPTAQRSRTWPVAGAAQGGQLRHQPDQTAHRQGAHALRRGAGDQQLLQPIRPTGSRTASRRRPATRPTSWPTSCRPRSATASSTPRPWA